RHCHRLQGTELNGPCIENKAAPLMPWPALHGNLIRVTKEETRCTRPAPAAPRRDRMRSRPRCYHLPWRHADAAAVPPAAGAGRRNRKLVAALRGGGCAFGARLEILTKLCGSAGIGEAL